MNPIRILQFGLSDLYYGTERVILNLYHHIDRSRFQFDFLVHHSCQNIPYEAEVEALGGHVFRQYYWKKEYILPDYIPLDEIWKMHPEIQGGIHSNLNDYTFSNIQPVLVADRRNMPIRIIHMHNTLEGFRADALWRSRLRNSLARPYAPQHANCLLACSAKSGAVGFGRRPFEVFPNAVDLDKFSFNEIVRRRIRKESGLEDKLVLGFVGRFASQKNPEFLLKVLQEINKKYAHAQLVLLGQGELEGRLRGRARNLGLQNITFMGRVDNVHEWMQAFDVLLLPSRFEGLGLVLIEGQASGLPCFASDRVPPEAAVTDRLTYLGLKDPAVWADAILNADLSYDRSRGRSQTAAAGYDIRESAKRLEEIYDRLLSD